MKDTKNIVMIILIGVTISLFFCFNTTAFAEEGIVSTSNLRLRKTESTSSEIITLLDENDKVEVLSENGDWYKIKIKDKVGYVNKQYIKVEGNKNDTTINDEIENKTQNNEEVEKNEQTENSTTNNELTDETENKNPVVQVGTITAESQIRIMPLINGDIIDTVKPGEKYEIISNVGLWSYVKNNEKRGWMLKDKLTISEETTSNIQADAINNDNKEPEKSNSEENKKEEKNEENTTETKYSKSKKYYVNGTSVNVRNEANKSSSVVKTLSKNAEITVTGEDGDWYTIELNGKKAYVSKQFLSSKKVETTSRSSNTIEEKKEEKKEEPVPVVETAKEEPNNNPPSNSSGDAIVSYAKQFLGYRYVYGTNGPNTFDCSGFVQYVYKHFGYSLSRSSKTQANDGVSVSKSNLQPGDILIFKNTSKTEIGHVGIYIGNDQFIHASNSRTGVIISSLSSASYQQRYVTARRVL